MKINEKRIQIQHLLKLNTSLKINKPQNWGNSNTTLVKVKSAHVPNL